MKPLLALQQTRRGYLEAASPERGTFGMLSGFWLSIGISRAINYVRERRRAVPRVRSLGRSIYHAPGTEQARMHHFVPGIGIAFATRRRHRRPGRRAGGVAERTVRRRRRPHGRRVRVIDQD
jgi:hypothetical protein